jgi:hypothetical protein
MSTAILGDLARRESRAVIRLRGRRSQPIVRPVSLFLAGWTEVRLRRGAEASLDVLAVDRTLETPVQRQIYSAIRDYVLDRRLPAQARLPATRDLAKQLGMGRNTEEVKCT